LASKYENRSYSPEPELRESVLRDLHRLLNTRSNEAYDECSEPGPSLQASAVCYGVRNPGSPEENPTTYAQHLAWKIRLFAPRLDPDRLSVQPIISDHTSATRWIFRIDGTLRTHGNGYAFRCFASFDLMEGRTAILR